MSIMRRRWVGAAGVLGAALALAAPAFAQHGGGGGGHGGGGGGGGGHASAGHFGGGGHASAGHFGGGGVHYAAGAHYAGGAHFAAAGAAAHGYGPVGHGYAGGAYGGHAAYGYPGGGYQHGYSTGATWRGGYWHGGYWPRAYYGLGFAWFLPVLPLAYATYWYDGLPYYYANDVYYTWNPDYSGYTATDPPPVTDSSAGADGAAAPPEGLSGAGQGAPDPSVGAQIFMYPKNGQSEQQQSDDKRECQQWAASQAGQGATNSSDYRRAMLACVEGRGYSAN